MRLYFYPLLWSLLEVQLVSSLRFVKESDFNDVRLDKAGYDKVKSLHYNWYLHGIKAIMGQLGKDIYKRLDQESRYRFYKCLDKIPDRRDIVMAAQCLMRAREDYLRLRETKRKTGSFLNYPSSPYQTKSYGGLTVEFTPENPLHIMKLDSSPFKQSIFPIRQQSATHSSFRQSSLPSYEKPVTLRFLPEFLNMKRRVKRSPHRLIIDEVSKSDSQGWVVKTMDKAPALKKVDKSPVQKIAKMVKSYIGVNETYLNYLIEKTERYREGAWAASYQNILTIKKAMDKRAKDPGAKVYDMRMLDLVLDRKHPTAGANDKPLMPPLVQEAYDLLSVIDKSPKAFSDGQNIKFLSPRFAPVMPDKADVRGKLSPSILSFYNDEAEEQIVPIPKLLEATGMNSQDREAVLETVMELSGARETVDKAMTILEKMNLFGMEGELKEVTEKVAKYFEELEKSFTRKQQKEMKKRGFTFLETNQIEDLYTKQGIRHHNELPIDINDYKGLTRKDKEESLWLRIEQIASNLTEEEHSRTKRQISWVNVLKPTVLAPYMFTPIYGLSVLGPTVLSPSLFSPLILNPSVLSPYVLSPAVGMPFILSPYLLSPYVLSPIVMAPFILNPYVLSPNVINPYVLSPLILSPLVLCPDLLSPQVLGGGILSPSVASPSILSKSVLMASVLSPSVLS